MTIPSPKSLLVGMLAVLLLPVATPAKIVSSLERRAAIKRAKVWQPVDVASMDTLNGPGGGDAFKAGQEVPCKYEEKDPLKPLGGHSPKFPCWTPGGERLKVKYDPTKNLEVFGEVAGARLFWALGFPAERMYSVKIMCQNCPADPWTSKADSPRATRAFMPATVQRRLPGVELSETEGNGWKFSELDWVDEKAGGSSRAEVDALKLLAVFANHGDNTPNQQRLLCPDGDAACEHPLMYVTDLGATFGGKDNVTSFRNWSRKKAVWKDPAACVADFRGTTDDFADPVISEGGRKLLSDLLGKLSDKQIRDLFVGAGFEHLGKQELPIRENGKSRLVTVDDWVRVFKARRRQIMEARCPG